MMDSHPGVTGATDMEDLENLAGVTVETTWIFPEGKKPLNLSTFKRWLAKINAEDVCKMLGCARDHCKCPHCKDMVRLCGVLTVLLDSSLVLCPAEFPCNFKTQLPATG